jgi:hypothetical protein
MLNLCLLRNVSDNICSLCLSLLSSGDTDGLILYFSYSIVFRQALQLYKGDPAPVILEIINTIEGGPPVDVSAVRSM